MTDVLELDLFGGDRIGFRLNRFELFNWGTFDARVWALDLAGGNGLLTGDIGSGKSTLVDGLTTLLVPPARTSYNKAAGAGARERTLSSYVLGHYKAERSELGQSARPVAMRSVGSYSVLLAVFRNEGLGQCVTLAQVFWHREASGPLSRLHVISDRPLSIIEDFAGFADMAVLRRRLRAGGAVLYDAFAPYAAEFRRRMGIDSPQALELFHQTVSMKSVGNLTDFVRAHMLEPGDVETRIANLISHVEDLTKAHDAVLTAKAQVEALTPLIADLAEHAEITLQATRDRRLRDELRATIVELKRQLLVARVVRLEAELQRLDARRVRERESLRAAQQEVADVAAALRENGGDRLEQLSRQIQATEEERDRRRRRHDDYERLCAQLGLPPAADAQTLVAQLETINGRQSEVADRRARVDDERSELAVAAEDVRRRRNEVGEELASLADRDSNIDREKVALRALLAGQLGISPRDLPFAGELLRITDPGWEAAGERLLRGFGLSMLVPERHYAMVSNWVDTTDLRSRLVYYRVRGVGSHREPDDARSLVHRLQVKPSEFSDWLRAEVSRRFDLVCATSPAEFRDAARAITRRGQIKSGGERHEKDDRIALGDRRAYVLGWDNAEKRAALTAEQSRLGARATAIASQVSSLQQERTSLELRAHQLGLLETVTDFAELDWVAAATRISELRAQAEALRTASDVLAELTRRRADSEERVRQAEDRCSAIDKEVGGVEIRAAEAGELLERLRAEAAPALDEADRQRLEALIEQECQGRAMSLVNADAIERQVRDILQRSADALDRRLTRVAERILRAMGEFRRQWPIQSQEMDASVEAGAEYRALLDRLVADDLPRFEAAFKRQLNVNAIREVVAFRGALDTTQQEIRRRVGVINGSLCEIDYQPSTYIRLEVAASTDPDVREFRAQLRACTEDTITGSTDDQYSEAKFLQVKQIVSRFVGREGRTEEDRRWTAKVTDVRTWFTFAASERRRDDDGEHEHYSDSGGKSGGQKEKLAYTILAASLAYQFGLVRGETHSRTFRFVVIDEAFGRGSDESARFGLELFGRLQLQLLVVTPLQKIHVIEPYVAQVGFVHNEGGIASKLRNLTVEEYREGRAAAERARLQAVAR